MSLETLNDWEAFIRDNDELLQRALGRGEMLELPIVPEPELHSEVFRLFYDMHFIMAPDGLLIPFKSI